MEPRFKTLQESIPAQQADSEEASILENLYESCFQLSPADSEIIRADFEELYQLLEGLAPQELDKIILAVCSLCRDHEKAGFAGGMHVGLRLKEELSRRV